MYRYIVTLISLLLLMKYPLCETCSVINTCEFLLKNGSIIDLTSLGYHDKARFPNMKAVKKDKFSYSYNPCFSFKMDGACNKGVAVCQSDGAQYHNCGDTDSVNCFIENNTLRLVYFASPRSTYVKLVCSEDAIEPSLIVNGEIQKEKYVVLSLEDDFKEETFIKNGLTSINLFCKYITTRTEMTLTSQCACPDFCRESHLSPGSVLVIIFMIFIALYLVLGIIHSSLTRGASGWELIPHYEFWADFPLLVRDGCVFVVSGCKPETAYERI